MKNRKNPGKILEPEITEVELFFCYLPYTSIVSSHKSLSQSNDNMVFYENFRARNNEDLTFAYLGLWNVWSYGIFGNFLGQMASKSPYNENWYCYILNTLWNVSGLGK